MKKLTVHLFLLVCITNYVLAQETKEPVKLQSKSLSEVQLARDMVQYGYSAKSATILAEAVQILFNNNVSELHSEESEVSVQSADDKSGNKAPKQVSLNVTQILADAKTFAKEDKAASQMVAQVEKDVKASASSKGRTAGPAYVTRRVWGKSQYTDQILFNGYELAEVAIVGDGDTDLDLYVYDSNGNLIGSDTDNTDNCYVSFTPAWTGRFTIIVKNLGTIYNDYVLLTN